MDPRLALFLLVLGILFFYVFPSGYAGYLLLERFGRGLEGLFYGVVFGPLGLILAWVMRDNALRDQEHQAQSVSVRDTEPSQRRFNYPK